MPAPSASDVPRKFDCLIDGQGYVFDDTVDGPRAQYGLTPTFIERQNTQGNYGDNQQDFWLTATQKDWSEGEQQRYARVNDDDSARRYWTGTSVDVSTPGSASIRYGVKTAAVGSTVVAAGTNGSGSLPLVASSTTAYYITSTGTVTSLGAHGLGGSPATIASDGNYVYFSSEGTKVRKMTVAPVFSDFSASGADRLAFLNNTLYGLRGTSGDLVRWDTAGTLTSLFTWKDATGVSLFQGELVPYGGKLAILRTIPAYNSELWIYDGTAPAIVARFPSNFQAYKIAESLGVLYISGAHVDSSKAAIYYYANGTLGLLWETETATPVAQSYGSLATWRNGIIFTDPGTFSFKVYDGGVGGVSTVGTYGSIDPGRLVSAGGCALLMASSGSSNAYAFSDDSTNAKTSSATITSSLFDFDSSLSKAFRGIKVDFDSATDGNGGTVDISYRVGDVDGSYTSLQTGATSGTEYTLAGITGRSISVKVTLNKGTSTLGPVLKRIAVRAAPVQPQYAKTTYLIAAYGSSYSEDKQTMRLRDGSYHTKTGTEMIADLKTAAAKSSISITDLPNGTYTGIIEAGDLKIDQMKTGEFRVTLAARQI